MEQEWKPNQPLPNADKAKIDPRKFEEYSLNPDNPNSQRKWIAFMTIGYDVNSSQGRHIATQDIINQLRATLPVECYENPEGYAIDLAIPDDRWIGGFDYENVVLMPEQFELVISPVILVNQ